MTTESKSEMTTSEKIVANDFGGIRPTLWDIVTKFPPKEEIIKAKDGTDIPMMISRVRDEAKTILYFTPSAEWESVREHIFK